MTIHSAPGNSLLLVVQISRLHSCQSTLAGGATPGTRMIAQVKDAHWRGVLITNGAFFFPP